jgi:uncharacterized protein (TIGR03437 family)
VEVYPWELVRELVVNNMRIPAFILTAVFAALPFVCQAQSELNLTPSRVVGHPSLNFRSGNPNVVDGRSMYQPWAVAVDTSSTPNALFVSDTANNRVLGWRTATSFANGAKADVILGQLDEQSTERFGPGTSRSLGFTLPGALTIDSKGNLYVVDTANNRILRFPKPFGNNDDIKTPDMVIGQPNFTSNTSNNGGLSEKTLSLSTNNTATTGLAFDGQGNLWFSDAQNNRVLRYPRAALDAGANGPAADIVLGEPDFKTNNAPATQTNPNIRLNKGILVTPSGITVDSDGRVYVSDSVTAQNGRVLVFTPPYFNGKEATRILGLYIQPQNQPISLDYVLFRPEGLVMMGNQLVVLDPVVNRIVRYQPFSEWPAESDAQVSPPATTVLGQPDFNSTKANRGLSEPDQTTIAGPIGAYYANNELYVADTNNNRVLVFPSFAPNAPATRVLGQTAFNFNSVNIVEGRELFLFAGFGGIANGLSDGGGVAVDTRSNPPRLYISDTFNNRVLGYKDARNVRPGDAADIVIGQNDLNRTLVNAPQNSVDVQTDTGLFRPTGLAVDTNGDLFVADSGNARVLRFASPFQQPVAPGERYRANLVIGQRNGTSKITDPSSRNLGYPFGIALTVERHLVVSDAGHNRVLFFRRPSGGDFTTGMAAEKVIGQPDFFTVNSGTAGNRMTSPRHIALDTDDRLYVADSGNSRVLIYDRVTTASNDPPVAFTIAGLSGAQGIWVSPFTGEIWIANSKGNAMLRYPRFERLTLGVRSDYQIASSAPLAVTQDGSGNLYVAEGIHRVAVFFNGLRTQIAGNYSDRPLSPGTIGIVYPRSGVTFSSETKTFDSLPNPTPMPKELADTQVLLDNRPLPLYFVSPGQINYFVPMDIANSGSAELQVLRKSTGEILAAGTVPLARVSPALFVQGALEQGQLAAINQDGTINAPGSEVAKGQFITLYATGLGFVPNAPPEGVPPTGPTPAEESIRVLINTDWVPDENIQYFGLAPGFVGLYQINVKVPTDRVAPGAAIDVVVQVRSTNSNIGFNNKVLRTTIAVKP